MEKEIKLNEQFIINLQGKSFVTYEGLLDYAHQNGLLSIEVEVLQVPNRQNGMMAICRATARTEKEVFTDIGDAAPDSVSRNLIPHLLRMASTRAKARALRDLTNIGMTAFEELNIGDQPMHPQEKKTNYKKEPVTDLQRSKLIELAKSLNKEINFEKLDKNSARFLIQQWIDESNSKQKEQN